MKEFGRERGMRLVQTRALSSIEIGPLVRWLTGEVCASGSGRDTGGAGWTKLCKFFLCLNSYGSVGFIIWKLEFKKTVENSIYR